jgi:hypothetical protein
MDAKEKADWAVGLKYREERRPSCDPDLATATHFLDLLVRGASLRRWAFQTFDDRGEDRTLAHTIFGPPSDVLPQLARLSGRGAGAFVAPAEFAHDATQRTNDNVIRVPVFWLDLDGAPLEPVMQSDTPPHVVVETSPGRFHCYWRVAGGATPSQWKRVQSGLAERFGGDASMDKPCGVMRLPGFPHQKRDPFIARIIREDDGEVALLDFLDEFGGPSEPEQRAAPVSTFIPDGQRNVALTSLAGTVRGRGCEADEILALLMVANQKRCRPPLPDREVRAIVQSVMRYQPDQAWWAVGDAQDAADDAWAEAQSSAIKEWIK